MGSYLVHIGGILGNFWPFLGHFVAYLDKFAKSSNLFAARFRSPGPLLECMYPGHLKDFTCVVDDCDLHRHIHL